MNNTLPFWANINLYYIVKFYIEIICKLRKIVQGSFHINTNLYGVIEVWPISVNEIDIIIIIHRICWNIIRWTRIYISTTSNGDKWSIFTTIKIDIILVLKERWERLNVVIINIITMRHNDRSRAIHVVIKCNINCIMMKVLRINGVGVYMRGINIDKLRGLMSKLV